MTIHKAVVRESLVARTLILHKARREISLQVRQYGVWQPQKRTAMHFPSCLTVEQVPGGTEGIQTAGD
jgi:hypothetical protein